MAPSGGMGAVIGVGMRMIAVWRIHHPQHRRFAGPEKTPQEDRCKAQDQVVEPGRVIPADRRFDDQRMMLFGNETQRAEHGLDAEPPIGACPQTSCHEKLSPKPGRPA
jgi:hypothetical protein